MDETKEMLVKLMESQTEMKLDFSSRFDKVDNRIDKIDNRLDKIELSQEMVITKLNVIAELKY